MECQGVLPDSLRNLFAVEHSVYRQSANGVTHPRVFFVPSTPSRTNPKTRFLVFKPMTSLPPRAFAMAGSVMCFDDESTVLYYRLVS
jgi:hypothetical protein